MNTEPAVKATKKIKFGLLIFSMVSLIAFVLLFFSYHNTAHAIDDQSVAELLSVSDLTHEQVKPERQNVKGIYLTAYSAGRAVKVNQIIDLINRTELNAIVIDIKDYSGKILYDSQLELVNKLKADENRIGNVSKLIKKLHKNNIYVIARQTVFQDPILAEKKPEWAIKSKKGGVWRDNKGLSWVDPTNQDVWDYNAAIAKEVIGFGFDEINFDYMRFPSDGDMSSVVYADNGKKKYESMRDFYEYLSFELADQPAWTSIDMFGLVMEGKGGEWDMNIGQRLADAVDNFDYVCPMMYPSHYPSGHLKLQNPAAHPATVILNGMRAGLPWFEGKRAQLRPWLQAFNIGAVYGAVNIRAEIDSVEKYADAGWMLWNASNRYTGAGLKNKK